MPKRCLREALVAALIMLASTPAPANALRIGGFNLARGGFESFASNDMAGLKSAVAQGFPGTHFVLKGKITSQLTSKVDVILLGVGKSANSGISPLSRSEKATLVQFVKSGGAVLIFTDNDTFDASAKKINASLLSPFGLAATGTVNGSQNVTLATSNDPIADGPFGTISSITTFYPGWFSKLGISTELGTLDTNGEPALAYMPGGSIGSGSGPVVLFSDSSLLVDANRTQDTTTAILNALALAP